MPAMAVSLRSRLASAFLPNRAVPHTTMLLLVGLWLGAALLVWVRSPFPSLPTPGEVWRAFNDLVVAGGTLVEIHGHTDNAGSADKNQQLSEARAFAVRSWLEQRSPANFPEGRVKVFAHGATQPLAPNATADGRAKNRRVEIVLGTAH